MKNYQTEFLSQYISNLRISKSISRLAYQAGNTLYLNNQCIQQSREGEHFAYSVEDNYQDFETDIFFDDENKKVDLQCNCNAEGFCSHKVSALLQLHEDLSQETDQGLKEGMKYTREGMINRVMAEREEKAKNEAFQLDFADNIYGEHLITNQRNKTYNLTFYDFEKKQGYCSCPDHYTNKLGSCKHLIYAFYEFEKRYADKTIPAQDFPFLEVFLHPLKDYRISWFYPGQVPLEIRELLDRYFNEEKQILEKHLIQFQAFISEAQKYKFINIRTEVIEKVRKAIGKQSLAELKEKTPLDFAKLNQSLSSYQKEGVEFIVFNKGAILADEIGLGKPLQAVLAAQFKKELFRFKSAMILCPNSLIPQWQKEIQNAYNENAEFSNGDYFTILGFDDFSKEPKGLDSLNPDLLIVDEAQNISGFDSDWVRLIKKIKHKEIVIITDSNPENSLMQFYTMVGLIDNSMLTPLWEFSYQHCLFDSQVLDKIVGYYNQEKLVKRLETLLLRRKKEDVLDQLEKTIPEANSDILIDSSSLMTDKRLSANKYREKKKSMAGQTSLFPLGDENKRLSLSGEEHKAFEAPGIEKLGVKPQIDKLLLDAQSFLEGLYTLQTGMELPWKAGDIDLKMDEKEIILRIKRK